jgi:hypothetical protein
MRDRSKRGRVNPEKGEDRYNHKLTEDAVREIRKRQHDATLTELGKEFGVDRTLIKRVVSGLAWKHVQ